MTVLELAPSQDGVRVRPGGDRPDRHATASTIRLVELRAVPTAVARATMPPDRVVRWLGATFPRLAAELDQKVSRTGPAFARYTAHGDLIEVEAGFPVRHAIASGATATASGLPGGLAAVAAHVGGGASLNATYRELEAWLDEYGLVEAAPHWEVYPQGPRPGPDAGLTWVVVPCRDRRR